MPSRSWLNWNDRRADALDQIERALDRVVRPGRSRATQQLNCAFAVLLAAHFQGYCRDLHSECVDALVMPIPVAGLRLTIREEFLYNRRLSTGNATQSNIASDFSRLGIGDFWIRVDADHPGNAVRRELLERLNTWT